MAKIFSSVNNFSSHQTEGGGTTLAQREGICAALSSLWCMHMLEGKRDLLTKPSYERAQALQALYRWDPAGGGQDVVNLMKRISLKGTVEFSNTTVDNALLQVVAKPGAYLFAVPGHALGAAILNNKYYFYDCDENGAGGLYSFDSADEWKQLVVQHYPANTSSPVGVSTSL